MCVGRPTRWGNPFVYRAKVGGLVRYRPETPDEFEFEGRVSADGMRHPYFAPDGTVTDYYVRWATRAEVVELYRRTLFEPDRGMIDAYPSKGGRFARVTVEEIRAELAGKDLLCWCDEDQPCHADLLLAIANEEIPMPQSETVSSAQLADPQRRLALPDGWTGVRWTDTDFTECRRHVEDPSWAASVDRSETPTGRLLFGEVACDHDRDRED